MAYQYPNSLNNLIRHLAKLPGIGPKSAQRMAFYIINSGHDYPLSLAEAIAQAEASLHNCPFCGNLTDADICNICADNRRDRSLLCVVEQVKDIIAMERSNSFRGIYHVLGGAISPLDGIGPEQLTIDALMQRLAKNRVKEVILATNPTVEGEATALYLAKKILPLGIVSSRIAHGLPVGGDLEYADEATLSLALNDRKRITE